MSRALDCFTVPRAEARSRRDRQTSFLRTDHDDQSDAYAYATDVMAARAFSLTPRNQLPPSSRSANRTSVPRVDVGVIDLDDVNRLSHEESADVERVERPRHGSPQPRVQGVMATANSRERRGGALTVSKYLATMNTVRPIGSKTAREISAVRTSDSTPTRLCLTEPSTRRTR